MKVKIRPNENKDNPLFIALNNTSAPDELEVELGNSFMEGISTADVDELLLEKGVEIDGIQGAIEVELSFLEEEVPESFPNSAIYSLVNDKEETRQKTWKEYTSHKVSLEGDKALLTIGYRDSNGNRKDIIKHAEFIEWYKHFGRDSMLLNETLKAKIISDYTIELEE